METAFWNWLIDAYDAGDLPDEELDAIIADPYKACDLFIECWKMDKYGTGELIQEELKRFKKHLILRYKKKNDQKYSHVGPADL